MSRGLIQCLSYLFLPTFACFEQELKHPQRAQLRVQNKILKQLAKTEYGKSLGIDKNPKWQHIPIVNYDDLEPWIQQQRQQPKSPILTPEKIHFWEQTSGSSGAAKWIPYTTSLIGSFSAMFCVWSYDLIRNGANFRTGQTYLCISPKIGSSSAGIDDTAYLSFPLRWLSRQFLLQIASSFPDVESFRWELATALLTSPDLEILSLWSPSFLTIQLEFIQAHNQELANMLGDYLSLERQQILRESPIPWAKLWSELKLISCWDRMYAADQAEILRQYFPDVLIQGKGLLATEAPMTIPLITANGFVPMLNQVVLEFIAPDGRILSLMELENDIIYELIISQLGGLCRYRIGDRVQVSHWYQNTPCLEFVGRGNQVSDLVGEKLTEAFVSKVLRDLGLTTWGFCCLVPVAGNPPHYSLLLERSPKPLEALTSQVETALQTGFHYRQARLLGQLAAVQVIIDPQVAQNLDSGKRMGDRKYAMLQTNYSKSMVLQS